MPLLRHCVLYGSIHFLLGSVIASLTLVMTNAIAISYLTTNTGILE